MGLKKSLHSGTKNFGNNIKNGKISPKKLIGIALITIVVGIVALFIIIIIAIFAIRWAWNSGSNTIQQSHTISSVVETAKQEVSNILPNVPTNPNDFIANNQIDTAMLAETYSNLPAQTQEVWKTAVEQSITESMQTATGTDLTALQELLTAVQAL